MTVTFWRLVPKSKVHMAISCLYHDKNGVLIDNGDFFFNSKGVPTKLKADKAAVTVENLKGKKGT